MIQCDSDDFMSQYMPFVPAERVVDESVRLLQNKDLLNERGDDWRWVDGDERKRFQFLVRVSDALRELKLPGRTASCQLVQSPDNYMDSQKPGADFKINAGYALISSSSSQVSAELTSDDTAVTVEYALNLADQKQNWNQLLSGVLYIMNGDPRRMQMFSLSIEHNMMTVWFFSRSHPCMSASFDMRKNNRRCIQVFIAFMFASREELGYDETVQLISTDREWHYGYKVGDRFYRSTRSVFQHHDTRIIGRGTRVWEVVRVKHFDDPTPLDDRSYALKDVWFDEGARTEREIQEALFRDLDLVAQRIDDSDPDIIHVLNGFDEETRAVLRTCVVKRELYSKYFLTINHDWTGPTSKPRAAHAVAVPGVFGVQPSPPVASVPGSDSTRTDPTPMVERAFVPRYQYRVVFDEVGEALHYVDNISVVLSAVQDCLFALQLLFLAGWVHRDISTGNLLWWNGRGLLADLEYAKKFEPSTGGSADPKTGTAFFMAVEIQKQMLIYEPPQPAFISFAEDMANLTAKKKPDPRPLTSVVVHNYEHDLESMFWVLLWIYMARLPHPPVMSELEQYAHSKYEDRTHGMLVDGAESTQAPDSVGPSETQQTGIPLHVLQVIGGIFQNHSGCSDLRYNVIARAGVYSEHISPIFKTDHELVARVFQILVRALRAGYETRKFDIENAATYSPLYATFRQAIQALQAHYEEHRDTYRPLLVYKARETIPPIGRAKPARSAVP
ncbi:hypothetical protein BD626DRAFT_569160 [Schizophyllum amplum]|uniref:Protein kinase domain-containing protein n=1 Tax=Schizophyllum amplum TaxID=97359 RepID=A0A550CEI7_9AGAR|nr:hypothetical protein BD626DRAFT_569160 [Auriculariopsis ampla]